MTLSDPTNKVSYNGTGSRITFDVPFFFFENADITVILRDVNGAETNWVEGTQYTLVGAGEETGRTLTVETLPIDYTPQNSEALLIKRVEQLTQPIDFPAGGAIPSAAMEEGLDRLTMLVQQVDETLARTFTVPATDPVAGTVLPSSVSRANKFLAFDAGGVPIAAAGTSADLTPVSEFINTLLDDFDAPTARATLDLVIGTDVLAPNGDGSQLTSVADVMARSEIDTIRANIALLAFRQAANHTQSVQNIVDGFVDEFEDEAGVNTVASVNENYDSTGSLYANPSVVTTNSVAAEWTGATSSYTFTGSNVGIISGTDKHIRSRDVIFGDFEFQFTIPTGGVGQPRGVGVYAITEDTTWGVVSGAAAVGFTNSWTLDKHSSSQFTPHFGTTSVGVARTPVDGEVHKIKRVGAVFTYLIDDVLEFTWTQQNSNPVRISFGTNGVGGKADTLSWVQRTSSRVPEATGTNIGNMVNDGGLAAGYDSDFDVTEASANYARKNAVGSSPATIGKDWGIGNERVVSHLIAYGLNNRGFVGGAGTSSVSVTLKLQASTDSFAASIVDLGSTTFSNVSNINTTTITSNDTVTKYRCHRLEITHTNGNTEHTNCAELQFMEKPEPLNMTLISNTFTAETQPVEANITIWQEDVDAVALNTDLVAEISRDGGTTFSAVTLVQEAVLTTGRLVSGKVSVAGQPVGSSMVFRITTPSAVPKEQRIHGVSLQWH